MLFLPGQWTLGEYDGETGNNDLPMALSFTLKLFFFFSQRHLPQDFVNNYRGQEANSFEIILNQMKKVAVKGF